MHSSFWKKATLEQLQPLKTTVYNYVCWKKKKKKKQTKKLEQQGTDPVINPKSYSLCHTHSPGAHAVTAVTPQAA